VRERVAEYLCENLADWRPDRAAATALKIKDNCGRFNALPQCVRAYSSKDPRAAANLAKDAVDHLRLRSDDDFQETIGSLYYFTSEDSPELRQLMERFTTWAIKTDDAMVASHKPHFFEGPSYLRVDMAGAWAQLDVARADRLMQDALKIDSAATIKSTDVGTWLTEGAERYIEGVAKVDGHRAAAFLKEHIKELPPEPNVPIHNGRFEAARILDRMDLTSPEQPRYFGNSFKDPYEATVDQRILAKKIIANPKTAYLSITQLPENWGMGNGCDQYSVATQLMAKMIASNDLSGALRLAKAIHPDSDRTDALSFIAQTLSFSHPEQSVAIFRQALANAKGLDPKGMTYSLIELGKAITSTALR
jgi:hypothetical protein